MTFRFSREPADEAAEPMPPLRDVCREARAEVRARKALIERFDEMLLQRGGALKWTEVDCSGPK